MSTVQFAFQGWCLHPLLDRLDRCVCVCIIPQSSEKQVAGMLFNSCNLWMLVIEQLFIYINISVNKQAASSFSCNFSVYWEA